MTIINLKREGCAIVTFLNKGIIKWGSILKIQEVKKDLKKHFTGFKKDVITSKSITGMA